MVPPRTLLATSVSAVVDSGLLFHRMWCSTCQQDVPGLGSSSDGSLLRCGKCGDQLASAANQNHVAPQSNSNASAARHANETVSLDKLLRLGPLGNEDWAIEAELRGVQRLLSSLKARSADTSDAWQRPAPHVAHKLRQPAASVQPSSSDLVDHARRGTASSTQPQVHLAAWIILSLGLAVFACGAVLLGWSLVGQRDDLWPVGMPLALIGQAGLILGLILQLDGLWNTSRQTAEVLSELDGELKTVREATTLLSTSHSSGSQSFYLHLAEGASPQMLLADLKGQMDLLAQQMARQK